MEETMPGEKQKRVVTSSNIKKLKEWSRKSFISVKMIMSRIQATNV